MKLNFLAAGRLRMKKSIYVTSADRSETIDLPVSSALIRHKQGNVLFDTGCHPSVVEHAEERWGPLVKVMTPIMRADETLLPSLACVGVGPDDIDIVVNSHFHPDHCGCNQFFKKATILAHAKEIEAAKAPGAEAAGYLRADWDYGQPIEAVNGERDLFGDASSCWCRCRATRRERSARWSPRSRRSVSSGFGLRSACAKASIPIPRPATPGMSDALLKSFEEVRRIEKSGATVICGHDDPQWQSLRKGNEGYE